ncbi:MAG TPA: hypothetical protein VIU35_05255 [Chitinophagaceae bacterium]
MKELLRGIEKRSINRSAAFLLAGLFFFNNETCKNNSQDNSTKIVAGDTIHLSSLQPIAYYQINNSLLKDRPEVLQLQQTSDNKKQAFFLVNVYLTDSDTDILIGNFSSYPANSTENFLFRIDKPLRDLNDKLSETEKANKKIQLKFLLEQKEKSNDTRITISQIKFIQKLAK